MVFIDGNVSFIYSMTATEGSKKFEGSGKVDKQWDSDYADSSSAKYKRFSKEMEKYLTEILKKAYEEDFLGVEVKNFKKGSVIFDFTVYLESTASVSADAVKEVIQKGDGGSNFTITGVSVQQVAGPTPSTPCACPTEKPEPTLETWIIVLIVTGTVIIILLITSIVLILVVSN